jgi:hypothetical protein
VDAGPAGVGEPPGKPELGNALPQAASSRTAARAGRAAAKRISADSTTPDRPA